MDITIAQSKGFQVKLNYTQNVPKNQQVIIYNTQDIGILSFCIF